MADFDSSHTNGLSEGSFDNVSFNDTNCTFCMIHEEYPDPFKLLHVQIIFIILYGMVFACSFIGNLLVIIVVLKHKKMRSVTNFFLANLAVADLAVAIFCVLPNLGQHLSPFWVLGRVLCKLTYFVQAMSYTASVTILTVISIERYVAILYPMKSKQVMNLCLLRAVVISVWIIAACCGIPNLFFYDTVTVPPNSAPNSSSTFCMVREFDSKAYHISNLILWYVAPLLLISGMYAQISMVLWKTSKGAMTKKESKIAKVTFHKRSGVTNQMYQKASMSDNMDSSYYTNGKNCEHKIMDDSRTEDEQIRLVQPGKLQVALLRGESVAEDYEDDWPGKKKALGKSDNPDLSGLRLHCKNNQIKSATSAKLAVTKLKKKGLQQNSEGALLARRRVIRLLIAVIASFAVCVLPYHIRVLWQVFNREPDFSFWPLLSTPITFVIYYMNSALNPLLYAFLSVNFRRSLWQIVTCQDNKPNRRNISMTSSRTMNTTM